MQRLVVAGALAALCTGCAFMQPPPPIPNATLKVDAFDMTLRRGTSQSVNVTFQRYLYGAEQPQRYNIWTSHNLDGVRVTLNKSHLTERDTARLRLEVARNAPAYSGAVYVYVTDEQGRTLWEQLEVEVRVPAAQLAPVRRVPLAPTPPDSDMRPPAQPAPVRPVPLP